MTDADVDAALKGIALSKIAEHLARRLGQPEIELRIVVHDGRYQRTRVVLPVNALPRV